MIAINPDKLITFTLSHQELILLLEHSKCLKDWMRSRVYKAGNRKKRGRITISVDEMESLLDAITEEATHAVDEECQAAFDDLLERLSYEAAVHASKSDPSLSPLSGLKGEIPSLLAGEEFSHLDEVNAVLQQHYQAKNQRPDPKMGGLSPDQVTRLIYTAWDDPNCPIQFNHNLSEPDLMDARYFQNFRIFLQAIREQNGIATTARGNLNRKFVEVMMDRMQWPNDYMERIRRYNKVFNEEDVFELHVIRLVCECGQLIRKYKKSFVLTRNADKMLVDKQLGELYPCLFTTFFRRFNLGYLDRLPECAGIQTTIAYSLYRLSLVATDWIATESLFDDILLPKVKEDIAELDTPLRERVWFVEKRIIVPLEGFGLLACRQEKKNSYPKLEAVKTTELFGKFISFRMKT